MCHSLLHLMASFTTTNDYCALLAWSSQSNGCFDKYKCDRKLVENCGQSYLECTQCTTTAGRYVCWAKQRSVFMLTHKSCMYLYITAVSKVTPLMLNERYYYCFSGTHIYNYDINYICKKILCYKLLRGE